MSKVEAFHKAAEELERRLRIQTFPFAVKLLKNEGDIPEGAQRPLKDMGCHFATCQGFGMSRREGYTMAMTLEDMYCPESVVGLGLAEAPDFFFDGHHRFPQSTETLEAGAIWAHEFPRLEVGKYIGVLSAPLASVNFEPDVIVIYCDVYQLATLLLSVASKEGRELTCTVGAKGACVYSVVAPLMSGNYQVSVPCPGDRRFAMAQRDEMIFSLPAGKLDDLLASLRYLDKYAYRLPLRSIMKPEADLPSNYVELGKKMGMKWMKGDELKKYK